MFSDGECRAKEPKKKEKRINLNKERKYNVQCKKLEMEIGKQQLNQIPCTKSRTTECNSNKMPG